MKKRRRSKNIWLDLCEDLDLTNHPENLEQLAQHYFNAGIEECALSLDHAFGDGESPWGAKLRTLKKGEA